MAEHRMSFPCTEEQIRELRAGDSVTVDGHVIGIRDRTQIRMFDHGQKPEMDLTGACNSEYLKGHQYSATGGQLDFVRGAYASRGGVSIIAFPSTVGNGKISKIVPHLAGPVTTPRTDVQYVVTERGVANLKGLSSTERAHALIGLAHPAFQEQLTAAAKEMHLI